MRTKLLFISVIILFIVIIAALADPFSAIKDMSDGKLSGTVVSDKGQTEGSMPLYMPGEYDSADTAVLISVDQAKSTVTFQNILSGRFYTLSYDGTTEIYDKYQQNLSLEQLMPGEILYVTFLKNAKFCNTMMVSPDAFSFRDVTNFSMDAGPNMIVFGGKYYNYMDDVAVFSGKRKGEMIDINPADILEVKGIGHTVYSVRISQGHGYLRLLNDTYFIGGWIEIGEDVISTISEGMLLVVPEGRSQVLLSNGGLSVRKTVDVVRGEETSIDLIDVEIEEVKKGSILFTLEPTSAAVLIDGQETDISEPVSLEYGIHQMKVSAEGYDSITQYIKVASETANISVSLHKTEIASSQDSSQQQNSDNASSNDGIIGSAASSNSPAAGGNSGNSGNSGSNSGGNGNSGSGGQSGGSEPSKPGSYKVYLSAPDGAEVYVDGVYAGIIPLNFEKKAGTHVLTLRKNGYSTRSYTIQVDSQAKDISYSFAELEKNEE